MLVEKIIVSQDCNPAGVTVLAGADALLDGEHVEHVGAGQTELMWSGRECDKN